MKPRPRSAVIRISIVVDQSARNKIRKEISNQVFLLFYMYSLNDVITSFLNFGYPSNDRKILIM